MKLSVYDANGYKWVLEERKDKWIWCHLDGDNEKDSGYIEASIENAVIALNEGGYMWKETK
jgi:hypothetical protein